MGTWGWQQVGGLGGASASLSLLWGALPYPLSRGPKSLRGSLTSLPKPSRGASCPRRQRLGSQVSGPGTWGCLDTGLLPVQGQGTEALQAQQLWDSKPGCESHRAGPLAFAASLPLSPSWGRWQLFLALDTWVFCSRRMSGLESLSGNPASGCCKQPHAVVAKLGAAPPPFCCLK